MKNERHQFYILDGKHRPIKTDVLTWGRWFEDFFANRFVAEKIIGDVRISTVCIVFDHRYFGDGPPLIFETMIFGGEFDQSQWRYSSWDDAVTGHAMAVKKVRAKVET